MNVRYDVSYPFLDVAKRYDVDYGDVLVYAEGIDARRIHPHVDVAIFLRHSLRLPRAAKMELINLCGLPVHERGGRHEEINLNLENLS